MGPVTQCCSVFRMRSDQDYREHLQKAEATLLWTELALELNLAITQNLIWRCQGRGLKLKMILSIAAC
jgi:hypothetical protein